MYTKDPQIIENGIREIEETKFVQSFITKPDMVCLDVGANLGYYTLLMSRVSKHVHAFEPSRENFELLISNLELNNRKATTYHYAVGPKQGITKLYKHSLNSGMHRIYESKWHDAGEEEVPMITLDSKIDYADFIKMDIEGSEYGALLGARKILERGTTLMMEFNTPSIIEYGAEPIKIYEFITELGYKVSLPDGTPLNWEELNKLGSSRSSLNIICRIS